jgi:hypothetical protein
MRTCDVLGAVAYALGRRSFAGVGGHVQAGRPKTIQPALALVGFASKPGLVMVDAFLRAESLERPAVAHHPELAVAVSAMILHAFFLGWRLMQPDAVEDRDPEVGFYSVYSAAQHHVLQCTISMR